jgi:hypothetical protein
VRPTGPSRPSRSSIGPGRLAAAALLIAALLSGCAAEVVAPSSPALPSVGAVATLSPAVALTRAELVRALGERSLVLADTRRPFRPPEAAELATVPRTVFEVTLPEAPDDGFLVVYEFADPATAAEGGAVQAAWLASGPGRIQAGPSGTIHVLRLVGPTLVYWTWNPEGAADPRTPDIQAALERLGIGVPVPG